METRNPQSLSPPAVIRAARRPAGDSTRIGMLVTIAVVGVYVAVRMHGVLQYSLWGGETFALDGVRMGWRAMIAYAVEDMVHPPLFYFVFKPWVAVGGESLLWLKLFPVVMATAALLPLIMLCRELRLSRFEINLALMLAAVNGYLIHYADEVRMYSMFMFLALCSGWLFVRYYNAADGSRRHLLILSATNLLLVYTHYFGWLMVGMELLTVLMWNRRRLASFTASVAVLVLLFLPWAYLVAETYARRGSTIGFIPRPTPYVVAYLYANLNGPLTVRGSILPGLLLFGAPAVWWTWHVLRDRTEPGERMVLWWLAGCSIIPVALVAWGSLILSDAFWFDRYFIFMAPFYLLLVAAAVHRVRPVPLRNGLAGIIVLWSVVAGYRDLTSDRMAWTSPQLGSRFDWEGVARQLAAASPPAAGPVAVYALPVRSQGRLTGQWAIYASIQFYLDSAERARISFHHVGDVSDLLRRSHGDEFWIATFELCDEGTSSPLAQLSRTGYAVTETLRSGRPRRALSISHLVRADIANAESTEPGGPAQTHQ